MKIQSAEFIKGVVGEDESLRSDFPQIAFIGRSNVGKSSVINTLANSKNLARSSSKPGKTTEINFYLINKSLYLADLPGYGFAKASKEERQKIQELISWYLFYSDFEQDLIVLIVDARVGVTEQDWEILNMLDQRGKNVVVVANKVDKLKNSEYQKSINAIQDKVGQYKVIPYSAEKRTGLTELSAELFHNNA